MSWLNKSSRSWSNWVVFRGEIYEHSDIPITSKYLGLNLSFHNPNISSDKMSPADIQYLNDGQSSIEICF